MQTYFISDGTHVKIGRSQNVPERLSCLQTSHSQKLTLLCIIDDDQEQDYHRHLADFRTVGEWFELCGWLPSFLERLVASKDREHFLSREQSLHAGGSKLKIVTMYGIESLLLCPLCDDTANFYQHSSEPECIPGNDGIIIRIPFWGECGHRWAFCFCYHAGQTWIDVGAAREGDYK